MIGVRQILVKKKKGPMFTKKKINKLIYTLSMVLTVAKRLKYGHGMEYFGEVLFNNK